MDSDANESDSGSGRRNRRFLDFVIVVVMMLLSLPSWTVMVSTGCCQVFVPAGPVASKTKL